MRRKAPAVLREPAYKTLIIPEFEGSLSARADGEVLALTTAVKCYNFDFNRGVLEKGYGLKTGEIIGENIESVWLFSREDASGNKINTIMFKSCDGFIYYLNKGVKTKLTTEKFNGKIKGINYRLSGEDVILICSDKEPLFVWNGSGAPYSVLGSPKISDLTMHNERMFVIHSEDKNSVWFSDDLDPTNWNPSLDEGGFISFHDERGMPERVLSFLGYVYVFRRYGITRVSATGGQTSFSCSNLYVPSGRIYSGTAALCGDKTVFLADEGLIQFDGVNINKIAKNISPAIIPSDSACSCYYGGKYYLSCKMRFEGDDEFDGVENNALLILDMFEGKFSVSKIGSISGLFALPEGKGLYAIMNKKPYLVEKTGAILTEPTVKVWRTGFSDLRSPDKVKRLRKLFFRTKEDAKVRVKTENKEKTFLIKGGEGIKEALLNLQGKLVSIEIESCTLSPKISSLSIKYID